MPALLHDSDFSLFNSDNHPSSPSLADAIAFALQKYPGLNFLPSNYDSIETHLRNASPATVHFSCDDFRMYEFKVRKCMRGRSHDWTECPFAHPGEKARRRDPRRIHYSGAPCPDFRKGSCRRGDACEFAHGVFECWLHPARYRTQVCKDGKNCKRRVCFFAHSPEQLRILPSSPSSTNTHVERADGSPVSSHGISSLHGSPSSQHNSALEVPTSPVLVASGSTSRFLSNDMAYVASQNNGMKAYPPAGIVMPHLSHEGSPVSLHLDSFNAASPLRRAMAQSFLAGKSYGGASLSLNSPTSSPTEYSPLFDAYSHMCRQPHLGGGNGKLRDGKFPELHLPLGSVEISQSYEPSCYSHEFASPTSTLAGHVFSPPPLSPPLSPLCSPNPTNSQCKGSFTNSSNSLSNFYVDDAVFYRSTSEPSIHTYSEPNIRTYSMDCMEDLAFHLQQLQLPEKFEPAGFAPQNSHESRFGMLDGMPLKSLGPVTRSLSCTSKQSMQGPMNQVTSKCYAGEVLQSKDAPACENAGKVYGEESFADNLVPDFGWVSELVK